MVKISDLPVWVLAVIFVIGAALGAWGMYTWGPRITEHHTTATVEKPVIVQGEHTTTTQVQYVEKSTDPATGRQEATDVQVSVNKSVVTVLVNGKPYEFQLLQNEQQKFEAGKIVLDQTSALKLDVTVPTIDRTKSNDLALEVTNRDISAEYTRCNFGVTVGKTWEGGIRAGGRIVYKF